MDIHRRPHHGYPPVDSRIQQSIIIINDSYHSNVTWIYLSDGQIYFNISKHKFRSIVIFISACTSDGSKKGGVSIVTIATYSVGLCGYLTASSSSNDVIDCHRNIPRPLTIIT